MAPYDVRRSWLSNDFACLQMTSAATLRLFAEGSVVYTSAARQDSLRFILRGAVSVHPQGSPSRGQQRTIAAQQLGKQQQPAQQHAHPDHSGPAEFGGGAAASSAAQSLTNWEAAAQQISLDHNSHQHSTVAGDSSEDRSVDSHRSDQRQDLSVTFPQSESRLEPCRQHANRVDSSSRQSGKALRPDMQNRIKQVFPFLAIVDRCLNHIKRAYVMCSQAAMSKQQKSRLWTLGAVFLACLHFCRRVHLRWRQLPRLLWRLLTYPQH